MKIKLILIGILIVVIFIGLVIGYGVETGEKLNGESVNVSDLAGSSWYSADGKSLLRFEAETVKIIKDAAETWGIESVQENTLMLAREDGKKGYAIFLKDGAVLIDWLNELFYREK